MFRRIKLWLYKNRKVKEQKTPTNRHYIVKFKVKINDINNPQVFNKVFNMVVPAKAAFFAKQKLRNSILNNIDIEFEDIQKLPFEEWEKYKNSIKEDGKK